MRSLEIEVNTDLKWKKNKPALIKNEKGVKLKSCIFGLRVTEGVTRPYIALAVGGETQGGLHREGWGRCHVGGAGWRGHGGVSWVGVRLYISHA